MTEQPAYYITTAISYPNGAPHIGHAYEAIATDALARFRRLDGYDVFFLTGVDEHGLKMKQTAQKEGLSPRELGDRNTPQFKEMCRALGVSNDDFIRTTEPRHYEAVSAIWKKMEAAGDIYLDTYAGWYSVRDEAFYAESETELGEDGVRRGPTGTPVEWTEEETYFFRLSKYGPELLKLYAQEPDFILPRERRNEVANFVEGGLLDLSISRTTLDWGVPVPDAPGHVVYVWVDALTNYITGVFAHGFLFNRGEKMSKSVGNVVDPFALVSVYGVDQLRYFLLREVPFGQDGSYSHEAIVARINADLANDLGNLAQRSLSMIAKNCAGALPEPGALTAEDRALLDLADGTLAKVRDALETQAIHKAAEAIWTVVAEANRYFAAQEPWALKKTDPARMGTVLYVTAETVRQVAILAQALTPDAAAKLLDQLAVPAEARDFAALGEAGRLVAGAALPKPEPVFPRFIDQDENQAAS